MATLDAILNKHTVIGLDTNPFIYLFEQHPRYFPVVKTIFDYLNFPHVQGVTSIITLIEVTVQPQRQGLFNLVQIYEHALLHSQQVHLLPIDIAVARQATLIRAKYNLRVPDALQIATALHYGATLFITNDHRLQKVSELNIVTLDACISE